MRNYCRANVLITFYYFKRFILRKFKKKSLIESYLSYVVIENKNQEDFEKFHKSNEKNGLIFIKKFLFYYGLEKRKVSLRFLDTRKINEKLENCRKKMRNYVKNIVRSTPVHENKNHVCNFTLLLKIT
jgi:hypothetical protein